MAIPRTKLIKQLQEVLGPDIFVKSGDEFGTEAQKGSIWTTGEQWSSNLNDERAFDYYNRDGRGDMFVAHPKIQPIIDAAGWWWEWYDPGTVFIYPKREWKVTP